MYRKRNRVYTEVDSKTLTDQSFKNNSDINFIVEQVRKTGLLPQQSQDKIPQFLDLSSIPDLEGAFNIAEQAAELFYDLPSAIRKEMDNDPSKLEIYLKDPKNKDTLIKNGIFQPEEKPVTKQESSPKEMEPSKGKKVSDSGGA